MIDRRRFGKALALGLLSVPAIVAAQTLPVVGILNASSNVQGRTVQALLIGMRTLGYVEGKHFSVEWRSSLGQPDAFPGLALELAKQKVAVIFAVGPAAVAAARNASSKIPIVAIDLESDPVEAGWIRSLSHPGGNVTGLFLDLPAVAGKWIELLRSVAPAAKQIGLLWDSSSGSRQWVIASSVAKGFGIASHVMKFRDAQNIDAALSGGVDMGIQALAILGSPTLSSISVSKQIVDFVRRRRLPAISPFRQFADAGGLMSYGPDLEEFQPHAAGFVSKILMGAKPADLAIEMPSKFNLVLSLSAAKALGLAIPHSLRLMADELI
jgi:putative ABC transport system substrate-binding protein